MSNSIIPLETDIGRSIFGASSERHRCSIGATSEPFLVIIQFVILVQMYGGFQTLHSDWKGGRKVWKQKRDSQNGTS